ncbi:hypothetical protein DL765_008492 [Monosporascus sp. GIB2]|nr:hypothetical protein DL765_008492 [Monosporascus sp. GIB2]
MHQTSSRLFRMTDERPFAKNLNDIFSALIVSLLPLSPHRVRFTRVEHTFLSEDAIRALGCLKITESSRTPDPNDPSRIVTSTDTRTFSMANGMARSLCQRFLDARFIESADGKLQQTYTFKGSVWRLTPKGVCILDRFCSRKGIQRRQIGDLIATGVMHMVILERDSQSDNLVLDRGIVEVIFKRFIGDNGLNVKSSVSSADSDSLSDYRNGLTGVKIASKRKVDGKTFKDTFTGKACSDWLMDCCTTVDRRETYEIASLFVEYGLMEAVQQDRAYMVASPSAALFQPTKNSVYQLTYRGKEIANGSASRGSTSKSKELARTSEGAVAPDSSTQLLGKILNDAALRLLFRENLRETHCEENLSFYQDADELIRGCRQAIRSAQKNSNATSMDGIKESMAQAYGIYNTFLAPGSPCELNIDHQLRRKFATRRTQPVGQGVEMIDALHELTALFEDAQNAVFKLMAGDSVLKFLRNTKYESTLKQYDFDCIVNKEELNESESRVLPEVDITRSDPYLDVLLNKRSGNLARRHHRTGNAGRVGGASPSSLTRTYSDSSVDETPPVSSAINTQEETSSTIAPRQDNDVRIKRHPKAVDGRSIQEDDNGNKFYLLASSSITDSSAASPQPPRIVKAYPEAIPPRQATPPQQQPPSTLVTTHPFRFSNWNLPNSETVDSTRSVPVYTTNMFKNSPPNVVHYQNRNFQPEEYRPEEFKPMGELDEAAIKGNSANAPVAQDDDKELDVDSDSDSVHSYQPSIMSFESLDSSNTSIEGQYEGRDLRDIFIQFLEDDQELKELFIEARMRPKITPLRFKRNLYDILKSYSRDLKRHAVTTDPDHSKAIAFITSYAGSIADLTQQKYVPEDSVQHPLEGFLQPMNIDERAKLVEQYLERHQSGSKFTDEVADHSQDDLASETENEEEVEPLQTSSFVRVKNFLFGGDPFRNLKNRLADFVRSRKMTNDSIRKLVDALIEVMLSDTEVKSLIRRIGSRIRSEDVTDISDFSDAMLNFTNALGREFPGTMRQLLSTQFEEVAPNLSTMLLERVRSLEEGSSAHDGGHQVSPSSNEAAGKARDPAASSTKLRSAEGGSVDFELSEDHDRFLSQIVANRQKIQSCRAFRCLLKDMKDLAYPTFPSQLGKLARTVAGKMQLSNSDSDNLAALVAEVRFCAPSEINMNGDYEVSLVDRLQAFLEDRTGSPWFWWPLKPPRRPITQGQTRLVWICLQLNTTYRNIYTF